MIEMEFSLKAVPQARARSGNNGFYTPKKSAEFKDALIGWYEWFLNNWQEENKTKWALNKEDAYQIDVLFYFKKAKSNQTRYHTQKPDLDNLYKAITDAMNGIFFIDDAQIQCANMEKAWTTGEDRIRIKLWVVD